MNDSQLASDFLTHAGMWVRNLNSNRGLIFREPLCWWWHATSIKNVVIGVRLDLIVLLPGEKRVDVKMRRGKMQWVM